MNYQEQIKQLPLEIQQYLLASVGADSLLELCDEYYLQLAKIRFATEILTRSFVGELPIDKIFDEIKVKLEMDDATAKEFTNKLLVKRFLVADEFFGGKVSEYLKAQSVDLSTTEQEIADYKKAVDLEYNPPEQVEEDGQVAQVEDESETEAEDFEPVRDRQEMLNIFKEYVVTVLSPENTLMRVDLNAVLVALLASDESFQLELLNVLSANQERVSAEKIKIHAENFDPTIGNWLKDFVSFAQGNDSGAINSLAKAKYFSQNENIRKVTPEEHNLLNTLFDLYENIKNFYQNMARLPVEELQVLPYSEEEKKMFTEAQRQAESSESTTTEDGEITKKDITEMYLGDQDDRVAMTQAVDAVEKATGRDAVRLADWLYDEIVARHRYNVIAGLKLAIEIGLVDDFVAKDRRYVELLEAHYKRNNREAELQAYKNQRLNLVHVKNFIKYLLMERLGMTENTAGRVAVQLSNIYRAQGVKELAQLAYFDVKSQQFKWI